MTRQNTTNSALLSVRGLKTYFYLDEGVVRAVDGISFDVERGQTVAIVGESGCGKSVAMRSILGLVDPPGRIVGGQILLAENAGHGKSRTADLAQLDPNCAEFRNIRGKQIALIFQEPMASFSPVHTVGNQIIEAIRLHRPVSRPAGRRLAVELLRHSGVPRPETRMNDYPHELSGGLLQRAMIAMALSCQPAILIADEPTTALDVTTQAQILNLLRQLQREHHMSIIFITHDLGVVAEMADIVVVMYLGRVVEKGPSEKVFGDPQHPYTKALLRSIPSIRSGPQQRLESIAGSIPHPLQRPEGCPFHNRCGDFIAGKCDQAEPKLMSHDAQHAVSCFLYSDVEES